MEFTSIFLLLTFYTILLGFFSFRLGYIAAINDVKTVMKELEKRRKSE